MIGDQDKHVNHVNNGVILVELLICFVDIAFITNHIPDTSIANISNDATSVTSIFIGAYAGMGLSAYGMYQIGQAHEEMTAEDLTAACLFIVVSSLTALALSLAAREIAKERRGLFFSTPTQNVTYRLLEDADIESDVNHSASANRPSLS